jgi:hypothetical protein
MRSHFYLGFFPALPVSNEKSHTPCGSPRFDGRAGLLSWRFARIGGWMIDICLFPSYDSLGKFQHSTLTGEKTSRPEDQETTENETRDNP